MLMIRLTDNKSPRFHTHGLKFVLVKYMMAATFRKFINVVVKSRMIDHPTLLQRERASSRGEKCRTLICEMKKRRKSMKIISHYLFKKIAHPVVFSTVLRRLRVLFGFTRLKIK